MHADCNQLCYRLFLFLWSKLLIDVLQHSRRKKKEKEGKSTRKGVVYRVYPSLFLTHNDW